MDSASSIFFIILLGITLSFTVYIVGGSYDDFIGSYTHFWETQYSETITSHTGDCMNVTLNRISTQDIPSLTLTYDGGSASDRIYVNGNYVGNLTPPSPNTLTFDPTYLRVDTCVSYIFSGPVGDTNITNTSIHYYRYDGCNYGEEVCVILDAGSNMSTVTLTLMVLAPLFIGGLILIGVVRGLL